MLIVDAISATLGCAVYSGSGSDTSGDKMQAHLQVGRGYQVRGDVAGDCLDKVSEEIYKEKDVKVSSQRGCMIITKEKNPILYQSVRIDQTLAVCLL